ncbi:MAG: hypothetical protein HGA83_04185, partial [Bacteroidales bacterium]|nr:hypothetical protein [Bacteroidales bacterium]
LKKTLSVTEFKEDFNNSKTYVPDEEISKQLKSSISGMSMSQMEKAEMKDLIKFLFFSANASIRQISSLTHENYSYITRILKERTNAAEKSQS